MFWGSSPENSRDADNFYIRSQEDKTVYENDILSPDKMKTNNSPQSERSQQNQGLQKHITPLKDNINSVYVPEQLKSAEHYNEFVFTQTQNSQNLQKPAEYLEKLSKGKPKKSRKRKRLADINGPKKKKKHKSKVSKTNIPEVEKTIWHNVIEANCDKPMSDHSTSTNDSTNRFTNELFSQFRNSLSEAKHVNFDQADTASSIFSVNTVMLKKMRQHLDESILNDNLEKSGEHSNSSRGVLSNEDVDEIVDMSLSNLFDDTPKRRSNQNNLNLSENADASVGCQKTPTRIELSDQEVDMLSDCSDLKKKGLKNSEESESNSHKTVFKKLETLVLKNRNKSPQKNKTINNAPQNTCTLKKTTQRKLNDGNVLLTTTTKYKSKEIIETSSDSESNEESSSEYGKVNNKGKTCADSNLKLKKIVSKDVNVPKIQLRTIETFKNNGKANKSLQNICKTKDICLKSNKLKEIKDKASCIEPNKIQKNVSNVVNTSKSETIVTKTNTSITSNSVTSKNKEISNKFKSKEIIETSDSDSSEESSFDLKTGKIKDDIEINLNVPLTSKNKFKSKENIDKYSDSESNEESSFESHKIQRHTSNEVNTARRKIKENNMNTSITSDNITSKNTETTSILQIKRSNTKNKNKIKCNTSLHSKNKFKSKEIIQTSYSDSESKEEVYSKLNSVKNKRKNSPDENLKSKKSMSNKTKLKVMETKPSNNVARFKHNGTTNKTSQNICVIKDNPLTSENKRKSKENIDKDRESKRVKGVNGVNTSKCEMQTIENERNTSLTSNDVKTVIASERFGNKLQLKTCDIKTSNQIKPNKSNVSCNSKTKFKTKEIVETFTNKAKAAKTESKTSIPSYNVTTSKNIQKTSKSPQKTQIKVNTPNKQNISLISENTKYKSKEFIDTDTGTDSECSSFEDNKIDKRKAHDNLIKNRYCNLSLKKATKNTKRNTMNLRNRSKHIMYTYDSDSDRSASDTSSSSSLSSQCATKQSNKFRQSGESNSTKTSKRSTSSCTASSSSFSSEFEKDIETVLNSTAISSKSLPKSPNIKLPLTHSSKSESSSASSGSISDNTRNDSCYNKSVNLSLSKMDVAMGKGKVCKSRKFSDSSSLLFSNEKQWQTKKSASKYNASVSKGANIEKKKASGNKNLLSDKDINKLVLSKSPKKAKPDKKQKNTSIDDEASDSWSLSSSDEGSSPKNRPTKRFKVNVEQPIYMKTSNVCTDKNKQRSEDRNRLKISKKNKDTNKSGVKDDCINDLLSDKKVINKRTSKSPKKKSDKTTALTQKNILKSVEQDNESAESTSCTEKENLAKQSPKKRIKIEVEEPSNKKGFNAVVSKRKHPTENDNRSKMPKKIKPELVDEETTTSNITNTLIHNFQEDKDVLVSTSVSIKSEGYKQPKRPGVNEDFRNDFNPLNTEVCLTPEECDILRNFAIYIDFQLPELHTIERGVSKPRSDVHQDIISRGLVVKKGNYTPDETQTIIDNWNRFCRVYDFPPKPELLMNPRVRDKYGKFVLPASELLNFVRYIAHGLPHRMLYSVYQRFRTIYKNVKHGKYTEEEDAFILETMATTKNAHHIFVRIGHELHRDALSIEKRFVYLREKEKHGFIDDKLSNEDGARVLRHLIDELQLNDVSELKDLHIHQTTLQKVGEKLRIRPLKIQQFWLSNLHPKFFVTGTRDMREVKRQLLDLILANPENKSVYHLNYNDFLPSMDGWTTLSLSIILKNMLQTARHAYPDKTDFRAKLMALREDIHRSDERYLQHARFENDVLTME